jgi:hypothetical protein
LEGEKFDLMDLLTCAKEENIGRDVYDDVNDAPPIERVNRVNMIYHGQIKSQKQRCLEEGVHHDDHEHDFEEEEEDWEQWLNPLRNF